MKLVTQTRFALPCVATEVMESLYQHRLLSTGQIHDLHTPAAHASYTRRLLSTLARAGAVEYASGAGRLKLWYLTPNGNDAVEMIATRAEHRRRQVSPEQAAGPLRMHTLAVNDVGVNFVKTARVRGDECGPLAWRHEIAHPIAPNKGRRPGETVIADALLTYTQHHADHTLTVHRCFIELDRATIPTPALAEKFTRYARLHDYTPTQKGSQPAWQDYYNEFPGVLVLLAHKDRGTLQRRIQNTIALHQPDSRTRKMNVLLALYEDLCEHGPFAQIFIDVQKPEHYVNWLGAPQTER
jgi:Replication-relaxation